MTSVLYYSNYCDNSKLLLSRLANSSVKKEIHFVCIDKRSKAPNGVTYVHMQNGTKLVMPQNITCVPSLLLLNKGNNVLTGQDILEYLHPIEEQKRMVAERGNGEPSAFALNSMGGGGFGVVSDNYSFLDQTADSMSAKGDGGLRQLHQYATVEMRDNIDTPPDNYTPDKVGDVSMEKLQQQRNSQIPPALRRT